MFERYINPHDSDSEPHSQSKASTKNRVVSALGSRKATTLKSPSSQCLLTSTDTHERSNAENKGTSLQRSRSEPDAASPSKSSVASVFSSPSRADSESFMLDTLVQPSSPSRHRASAARGQPSNGLKRTYGGARTIKTDESQLAILEPVADPSTSTKAGAVLTPSSSLSSSKAMSMTKPARVAREAYSALRQRWGADEEEAMADAEQLKSAVQMKARGETARLTDESAYLLEGLGAHHAVGLRRTSAIEVLKKLAKDDFRRRIKASGIVEDVYCAFRRAGAGEGDRV